MENNCLTLKQGIRTKEENLLKIGETIKIDKFKNIGELYTALKGKGDIIISCPAKKLLGDHPLAITSQFTEINLIDLLVIDIGFKSGATYGEIISKATRLGLDLCSFEVAPQLCLNYSSYLKGGWLCIAMEPIKDSIERPTIFKVELDFDKSHLDVACGSPYYYWDADQHFIFCYK
ncbi:MAG TPA: hypothetical protein VK153_01655 [Candidatus Paceibacterota bacterium]|nr:hypothetical protein [Candidatus Paceibacterota bacterium]